MQPLRREAFFLPGAAHGGRFCLLTRAAAPVGTLVFVHAFAEEMSKSRRMVALAARAFAERGWNVLQVDLSGCGDSGGELADVSWATWIDDLRDAEVGDLDPPFLVQQQVFRLDVPVNDSVDVQVLQTFGNDEREDDDTVELFCFMERFVKAFCPVECLGENI